jgi:uncharacterized membrane protein YdjX (TVP38/TMEM64 family)
MNETNQSDAKHLKLAMALLACGILLTAALAVTGNLSLLWCKTCDVFQSKEALRDYIESWGAFAPAAFIAIQSLQVVIAPIPGELTGAVGGFVFGTVPNLLYSTIGLTVGSVLAYLAARVVGLPLVKYFVSEELMNRFHFLTQRKGALLALVLFTVPGFPKDILSYLLGLSPMTFVPFFLVSTIGRIPGTIMLSLSGSAVYDENWALFASMTIVSILLAGSVFLLRNKIDQWLAGVGRQPS